MSHLFAFAWLLALPSLGAPAPGPGCTFEAGTTTCVTVSQTQQHQPITMVSGCLYGPEGVPGRRERVFDQTWLVTAATTTLAHGLRGAVYGSSTTVTRALLSQVQVSDTCSPL